jgi:signal transduction histidine kinase
VSPLSRVNDPDRLRALVAAVLGISSDLSLPHVLHNIVTAAIEVIGARYGALGVLSEDEHGLSEFVHVGIPPDEVQAIGHLPEGHGILGLLIVDPRPLRLSDLTHHPQSYGFPAHHPRMRSFLGVPILVRDQVFGNLYLTEKDAAEEFSAEDEGLAVALAGAAGIAIENARLHARVRDLTLIEDRERIAADLHDTVIQRLFATGLALQGTVRAIPSPEVAARIESAVGDLDETIRQIRSTIFALQAPRVPGRSLRAEILGLATEAAASLRFEPQVQLAGPLDAAVDEEIGTQLLSVLREGLSNVVRHAHANRVEIIVAVDGSHVQARIYDDGVGPGTGSRAGGRGLENLSHRAESLGGHMHLSAGPDGRGTELTWQVPLAGQPEVVAESGPA